MPKEKSSKRVNCDILFDNNPNGIFKAGDAVSGSVTLTLTQLKKVRGVCLLITGFAETFWTSKVPHGPNNKKTKAQFKGREDFIAQKSYLVGSETGNPIDLPIGTSNYTFQLNIPQNVPTSMEGKYGHVRYVVKVTLERPWKHDQNFQMPFTVLAKVEFDEGNAALARPIKVEDQLRFYCWICRSAPLMVTATIPRSGYVPGDTIKVVLAVNNLSKEDVSEIVVKFQKVITFMSQVQVVEETQLYAESKMIKYETLEIQKTLPVARLANETFEKHFSLGPITPTEDRNSKIIKIGYELDILVRPKLSTKKIELVIPVVIGSAGLKTEEAIEFARSTGIDKLAAGLERENPSAPPPPYYENDTGDLYPASSLQKAYERELSSEECDERDKY
ncbi:arrestin domain-containing protein 3-like [Culex pipiens pallens]|uniref:arrestin domain-containing protein 3-like n=1 Tax=Culex pipiens pallens TaxID=42434 RepID=UPI0019542080|nr:arrestin domain-containing protein 3-like [Culex pipiens pallens]